MLLYCWPILDTWWGCRQLWSGCDTGNILGWDYQQQSNHMLYISFWFEVYCFGAETKLCLFLTPWHQPLEIACLSHWRRIWSKLVCVLGFLLSVCTPWRHMCPHQWLHWKFWSDRHAVSLVGSFWSNFLGESWLSSVVCPSLDFVYTAEIFGVVSYMMVVPCVLSLLSPLVVYNHIPRMQLWVWFLSF